LARSGAASVHRHSKRQRRNRTGRRPQDPVGTRKRHPRRRFDREGSYLTHPWNRRSHCIEHPACGSVVVSEMRNERPKVFYGWWVALTAALGLFLNTATIVVFSFGFFAKAIGEEVHGGRAKISLAFTIHNLTSALFI